MLMYALDFMYHTIAHGAKAEQAHRIASAQDDDRGLFRLYTQER